MVNDKQIKRKYSKMAKEYDAKRFGTLSGRIIDKKQKSVLIKFLKDIPQTAKILEVGCGSGRFLEFLEKMGYKNVYGIDSSKEMLEIAGKKTKATLKIGNVYKIPYGNNSFDVVFSVHVLMHIQKPKKMIEEMIRVSKNIVIFDITNKQSLSFAISKICKGYKPKFYSVKNIKEMTPDQKDIIYKPTYMFPMKGHLSLAYYAIAWVFEKIAFVLQLGKFASQLFIKIKKNSF